MPPKRRREWPDSSDGIQADIVTPVAASTAAVQTSEASSGSRIQDSSSSRNGEAETSNGNETAVLMPPPGPNIADVLPGITRKITACASCRKLKIKCDMPPDGPPCTRCRQRSLSCILNRSLQSILEETRANGNVKADVRNLYKTVETICQHLSIEGPQPLLTANDTSPVSEHAQNGHANNHGHDHDGNEGCEVSPPESPSASHAPIDTFLNIAKLGSPGSADPPHCRRQSGLRQEDLVSKEMITLSVAGKLVERYASRLDHYLYGIAGELCNVQRLRSSSPTLFAAICTVSALHDPQDPSMYEICNRHFRQLVSQSTFEKRDVEYIRALCICSFWLADASRILSSDAVRRAADLRLHRTFDTAFGSHDTTDLSPVESADRIRLWYLLFVCDQHLSILHNRDSLLRSDKTITVGWESYLQRAGAVQSDVRIVSQVSLLLIMSEVRAILGADGETQMTQVLVDQIFNYSRQLDRWFAKFSALFQPNAYIGDFPRKGLELHYQFGKLYLGHHVFKKPQGQPIPAHFLSAATMAHDAAVSIFDMILRQRPIQASLVGVPHYFHIMIAFAGHFLLEVCKNHHEQLCITLADDFALIGRTLTLFQNTPCIAQHPLCRMTPGLSRKLYDCAASFGMAPDQLSLFSEEQHSLASARNGDMQTVARDAFGLPLSQSQITATDSIDDAFLFQDLWNFNFMDMMGVVMT